MLPLDTNSLIVAAAAALKCRERIGVWFVRSLFLTAQVWRPVLAGAFSGCQTDHRPHLRAGDILRFSDRKAAARFLLRQRLWNAARFVGTIPGIRTREPPLMSRAEPGQTLWRITNAQKHKTRRGGGPWKSQQAWQLGTAAMPSASHGRVAGLRGPMPCVQRQRSPCNRLRSRRSAAVNRARMTRNSLC
jgi:hypothetical protein